MGEILLYSHSSPLGEILLYSSFSGGKFYYGGKNYSTTPSLYCDLPTYCVHLSCALYSISNTIYFYHRTLNYYIDQFEFKGTVVWFWSGGGGGLLFWNIYADPEKLTLNNLSSKYFAIVRDTSAIVFKKNWLASPTSICKYSLVSKRRFYPLVDAYKVLPKIALFCMNITKTNSGEDPVGTYRPLPPHPDAFNHNNCFR